jgi:hypothetical protein
MSSRLLCTPSLSSTALTATDLGRPGDVRGTDPLTVPSRATASDRHPRHDLAVAPGLGETTLDPASTPPNRRPVHGTRAAPIGSAAGRRELFLGLPTDPRRTRRARLQVPASTVWSILRRAGIDPVPRRDGPSWRHFPARASLGAFSPQLSSVSTRCCFSGSTCCSCAPRGAVVVSGWR